MAIVNIVVLSAVGSMSLVRRQFAVLCLEPRGRRLRQQPVATLHCLATRRPSYRPRPICPGSKGLHEALSMLLKLVASLIRVEPHDHALDEM